MKKSLILIIFLSLFFIISAVNANDLNSSDSKNMGDDSNTSKLESIMGNYGNSLANNSIIGYDNKLGAKSSKTRKISSKKSLSIVSTKNIVTRYGKKTKFSLKIINKKKKPVRNELVVFKIANKKYNVYTNKKGFASISLKLNAGKYTISYSANGCSGKNTWTVKNSYKITLYKWKSGANVLENKKIKSNVPRSKLVKRMIKLAKSGTPIIKFKGGNGKVVFISAGCHGNELPSQMASMRLIKYLQSHYINGTVYVMPFMNPKATARNIRNYNGVNLNMLANKKGSISYKTVSLIKKFKCDAYGDFHATRPGGTPGKNVAMGTYNPTFGSADIAKFIAKRAKVSCIIYDVAGDEYPGALEDAVNLKGIPAVTCEVISPHGKIKYGSISKSLRMMKVFLKYNKII